MKKFENPYTQKTRRSFWHFLLWSFGYYHDPQPHPMPRRFLFPNPDEEINPTQPLVTWVNHSTFWIVAYGYSILVDPIWNHRCSPLPFMGPKRNLNAKPHFKQIGQLDYVIISHNHYDHLDKKTIWQLFKDHPCIQWIVPLGVKKWFLQHFPIPEKNIVELNWWESFKEKNLTFTAVPAQHFSGRGLFDRDRSLWMGCVVEFANQKRFYFAGDTGYNPFDFKVIGHKFKKMDLSLLPIGVYSPRKFMQPVHINPKESVLIHQEVNSALSVGGHWGTFRLSSENLDRPPFDLFCALKRYHVPMETFRVLQPGQAINW